MNSREFYNCLMASNETHKEDSVPDLSKQIQETRTQKARLIRRMYDHPDSTGVGSSMDNDLHDLESREAELEYRQDGWDETPPCGHRPSFKMGVGTFGCWTCGWMFDFKHWKWFGRNDK